MPPLKAPVGRRDILLCTVGANIVRPRLLSQPAAASSSERGANLASSLEVDSPRGGEMSPQVTKGPLPEEVPEGRRSQPLLKKKSHPHPTPEKINSWRMINHVITYNFSVTPRAQQHDHAEDHAAGGAGTCAGDRGGDCGLWTTCFVYGDILCSYQYVHRTGLSAAHAERSDRDRRQRYAHRRAAGAEPAGNPAPVGGCHRLRLCRCCGKTAVRRSGLQLCEPCHHRTCVPAAVLRRRYDHLGQAVLLSGQ